MFVPSGTESRGAGEAAVVVVSPSVYTGCVVNVMLLLCMAERTFRRLWFGFVKACVCVCVCLRLHTFSICSVSIELY